MSKKIKDLILTARGVIDHASKTGQILDRKAQERLTICSSCTQYDPRGWCKQCGCYLKVKARLAGAKCPLNLW